MWVGPSNQQEIQAEFDGIFGRSVVLGGEAYVAAPEEAVRAVYYSMMAKRHHYPEPNLSLRGRGMLRSVLSPGNLARLEAYDMGLGRRAPGSFPESYMCDVDHWPGSPGDTAGGHFPCQLTHGHVVAYRKRRLVIGMEHLFAQGWHVFPQEGDLFVTKLLPKLQTLSEGNLKKLSGNGMHLPSIAAWYLYCFSRIVRSEDTKLRQEATLAGSSLGRDAEDTEHEDDE